MEARERAEELVEALEAGLAEAGKRADNLKKRPRVSSNDIGVRFANWRNESACLGAARDRAGTA